MAPRALSTIGSILAKEIVHKVVDHSIKKYPANGRRLGGSKRRGKNIEAGVRRMIEYGADKTREAGGFKNIVRGFVEQTKRRGFLAVADDVMKIATAGLVKVVNPPGFAAVFKADGTCQLLFKDSQDEESTECTSNSENSAPPMNIKKESAPASLNPEGSCDRKAKPVKFKPELIL